MATAKAPIQSGIYNDSEAFPMAGAAVLRTFKLKVGWMEIWDCDPKMSTFRN